jgi:glycosyltransferase involved in cell wall biosynthesis
MTPLLTIIVPVYNIKEYLPRCVKSITDQTYRNLEVILVDDGSTDGTGELCDVLATQDERIRVFHKENGGSSSARNLGISKANGQYFGFVDSDDYISPEMYERLVSGIGVNGAQIVQIGRDEVNEKGDKLPNICEPPIQDEFISSKEFLKELLMHRGDCSYCTKLVDRALFEKNKFPIGALNEDFHLLVKMLMEANGVMSLSGQTYHVFYRIGSNTRKKDKNDFSRVYGDCVDNADMVQAMVDESFPELRQVAMRFGLFQRLEYLLHIPIVNMKQNNIQYREICTYVRKHILDALSNTHLTKKNKIYLLLFAISPKGLRQVHAWMMKMRQRKV